MKEFIQPYAIASLPSHTITQTTWWAIRHFLLLVLLLIAGTWDFLLGYNTVVGFDDNIQDFGRFYYATKAFLQDHDMYGPTLGTFIPMTQLYGEHLWNLNPPHFHFLFFPLVLFDPQQALVIWTLVSSLAFFFCGYLIISELRISLPVFYWGLVALAILAFGATGFLIRTAQVSFLLMVPFTLSWINARRGNWNQAAIYLGILSSIKLFFLIFIPYFVLRRMFREFSTFTISSLCCIGLGLIVFGSDPYLSWMHILPNIDWAGGSNNASLLGFLTRAFSENPHFQPITTEVDYYTMWIFLAGVLGIVTILVSGADSFPNSVDRGFALLVVGAMLISPVGWIYYFFLPLGPMVALCSSWKEGKLTQHSGHWSKAIFLRNALLFLGIPGLFLPSTMGGLFQPNVTATILLASTYFWSTLFIWAALMSDWFYNRYNNFSLRHF